MNEHPITFDCQGSPLVGIVHRPEKPSSRGVVMVMGAGPQYRVGGHRHLVLWARRLCDEGFAVLRFDYRGMGDSHGEFRGFEQVDDDIEAAISEFRKQVAGVEQIVLWGQCDAASAILFYGWRDPRVAGVVLMNPWVRTDAGQAKAIIRYYYLSRLMQPSFWRKVGKFQFNPVESIRSAARLVLQSRSQAPRQTENPANGTSLGMPLDRERPLPELMLDGLSRLKAPVLLVLSGRDLVAREFELLAGESAAWRTQLANARVTRHASPESDHTFSSAAHRAEIIEAGLDWLRRW